MNIKKIFSMLIVLCAVFFVTLAWPLNAVAGEGKRLLLLNANLYKIASGSTKNILVITNTNNNVDFNQVKETLKQQLAEALYADISEIEEDQKFVDLGLDSIVGVEWITAINRTYNLNIKATKLYDYPTLLELTKYIAQEIEKQGVPVEIPQIKTERKDLIDSQEDLKEKLRSILNRVAKKELSVQEANQMIKELKQR